MSEQAAAVAVAKSFSLFDIATVTLVSLAIIYIVALFNERRRKKNAPPLVSYWIPYVGSIVGFGKNPLNFILDNSKKVRVVVAAQNDEN